MNGALEIGGSPGELLDDDLLLRVRGGGPDAVITWRARLLDDDGRVWRATARRPEQLASRWVPAKDGTGSIVALRSLRPVAIELRAEAADGRAAARTVTRRLAGDGVRTRRWRDGVAATLHVPTVPGARAAPAASRLPPAPALPRAPALPPAPALPLAPGAPGAPGAVPATAAAHAMAPSAATLLIDATAGATQATVATLAAALLASRGVLVLVVVAARGGASAADQLATARERLAALPAAGDIVVLPALDPFDLESLGGDGVVLPPGVGARDPQPAAAARAVAWDALLARLGAHPRQRAT